MTHRRAGWTVRLWLQRSRGQNRHITDAQGSARYRPTLLAVLLAPLLLTTGCAHRLAAAPPPMLGYIGNYEAVRAAQDDPARGISGIFAMTVQAIGSDDGRIFLNSERDYRHPLNITLNMGSALRPGLEGALGLRLDNLQNRRLLVRGTALPVPGDQHGLVAPGHAR